MRIKEGGPLSGTFQIKNDLKPEVYKRISLKGIPILATFASMVG